MQVSYKYDLVSYCYDFQIEKYLSQEKCAIEWTPRNIKWYFLFWILRVALND